MCHEANDRSRGNGCALRVDSVYILTMDSAVAGAQLCQYGSCLPWKCLYGCGNGHRRPLSSFDELLSMAVLTASWWMLLMADLLVVFLSDSSARYCRMSGLDRPIRDRRRSGR